LNVRVNRELVWKSEESELSGAGTIRGFPCSGPISAWRICRLKYKHFPSSALLLLLSRLLFLLPGLDFETENYQHYRTSNTRRAVHCPSTWSTSCKSQSHNCSRGTTFMKLVQPSQCDARGGASPEEHNRGSTCRVSGLPEKAAAPAHCVTSHPARYLRLWFDRVPPSACPRV
jgi:hypothetical protein